MSVFDEDRSPLLPFHPPVIACGGGSHEGVRPNTLSALKRTRDLGIFWVSLDIKLTQDGVPVLLRGEDLSKETDGQGLISEVNWSEARLFSTGPSESLPSLTDAMEVVIEKGLFPVLWLRPSPGRSRVTTMVSLIEMAKVWPEGNDSPLVVSTDLDSLIVAAQLLPQWPRALFMESWREDWREAFQRVSGSAIGMPEGLLTPEKVKLLRTEDCPVLAYDVNRAEGAKTLLDSGVAALVTDHAREVLAHVR